MSMSKAPSALWPLALVLSTGLLGSACGDDEGVTPVCPNVADCQTPPGDPPPRDGGNDADLSEGDASEDESPSE